MDEASSKRLVFFGEIHGETPVVKMQSKLQRSMAQRLPDDAKLHVVMEHFSFDMQSLLDLYTRGELNMAQLQEHYDSVGTEGHQLAKYERVLKLARDDDRIKIHAGYACACVHLHAHAPVRPCARARQCAIQGSYRGRTHGC